MKRQNPYSMLMERFAAFARKTQLKQACTMWSYPKDQIDNGAAWGMSQLRERVIAARQLGKDVEIIEKNGDLIVQYVNQRPEYPL